MIKDNKLKKIYIKEALGNRNYLSYRTDLILLKILVSFAVFIATYFIYLDLILSLLIASLIFFISTLINKINVNKKNEKGKEMLINKVKEEYFSSKLKKLIKVILNCLLNYFSRMRDTIILLKRKKLIFGGKGWLYNLYKNI